MDTVEGPLRSVVVMSGDVPVYQDLTQHHRGQDFRRGHVRQMFGIHDPASGISYRAGFSTQPPGPAAQRHRHNFEQIRFIIDGEWRFGKGKYGAGWLGFFPEGAFYGPQQNLVETRGFVIQYPGPSGARFVSRPEERAAQREMVESGVRFESGLAHFPEGKRQDGAEALWEHIAGKRLKYPKPLYQDRVWLDTALFEWVPSGVPGVSIKRLGYFNTRGPAIALLRIDPGYALPAGHNSCPMMRYLYEGEALYAGQRLPSVSSLYYPPDAPYEALKSDGGATLLSVELQLAGDQPPAPYRI